MADMSPIDLLRDQLAVVDAGIAFGTTVKARIQVGTIRDLIALADERKYRARYREPAENAILDRLYGEPRPAS